MFGTSSPGGMASMTARPLRSSRTDMRTRSPMRQSSMTWATMAGPQSRPTSPSRHGNRSRK